MVVPRECPLPITEMAEQAHAEKNGPSNILFSAHLGF